MSLKRRPLHPAGADAGGSFSSLQEGKFTLGIDASRNRSGGARVHLLNILECLDPSTHGMIRVHLWAYRSLADTVPDYPWLAKHTPSVLERSLFRQTWWQFRDLPREARAYGCDLLFTTDTGSVCPFRPAVALNQDLLAYERGEMQRYGLSWDLLRLMLLRSIQTRTMRRADGVIFLTAHASRIVQEVTGPLRRTTVIPHGVEEVYRQTALSRRCLDGERSPTRILYVSNAAMHKHQWKVVDAVGRLRLQHDVSLLLVGGGDGPAQALLDRALARADPHGRFIEQRPFVSHGDIPRYLSEADLFVFASSCESFGITLLEAMAAGLPIACSNRSALPELLEDGGVYFDPEDPAGIAAALEMLLTDARLRAEVSMRARKRAAEFTWVRAAEQTWRFIAECYFAPGPDRNGSRMTGDVAKGEVKASRLTDGPRRRPGGTE